MVKVRFIGSAHTPLRYDIYVGGTRHNGAGYRFGQANGLSTAMMTQEEADVLTGATPALWTPDGQPINAVVRKPLSPIEDEQWEMVGG